MRLRPSNWLLPVILLWTNPPEPDAMFVRFRAWQPGIRLESAPYAFSGPDEWGGIWVRSGPGLPDSCNFALPRGTWSICATATDTTGRNESGCSDTISVYSDPGTAPMRVQVRMTRNYIGPVLKRGMPVKARDLR